MSNRPSFAVSPNAKEIVFDALDEVELNPRLVSTVDGQTHFFFENYSKVQEAVDAIAHLDVNPVMSDD